MQLSVVNLSLITINAQLLENIKINIFLKMKKDDLVKMCKMKMLIARDALIINQVNK